MDGGLQSGAGLCELLLKWGGRQNVSRIVMMLALGAWKQGYEKSGGPFEAIGAEGAVQGI